MRWHEGTPQPVWIRTPLRDFTRANALLAQIAQFTDPGREKLYYYGKYLLNELDTRRDPATVDLDGSVVLTHLRTEMTADQIDGSLDGGSDEPLLGIQDGEGKKYSVPEERLSELIHALNERFGMNLTDADRILFDQQVQSMVENGDVQDAAKGNDFDQFSVFAKKRLTMNLLRRHSANEDLVKAFLDVPEFKEMVEAAVLAEVYEKAGA